MDKKYNSENPGEKIHVNIVYSDAHLLSISVFCSSFTSHEKKIETQIFREVQVNDF